MDKLNYKRCSDKVYLLCTCYVPDTARCWSTVKTNPQVYTQEPLAMPFKHPRTDAAN